MKFIKYLALSFLVYFPSISRAQAPTNGLVAYYPLDNGTSVDASGNSHNGNITGGITQTANRNGEDNKALQFNGTDAKVTVSNWGILTGGSSRTISAWFKTTLKNKAEFMVSWGGWTTATSCALGTWYCCGPPFYGFIGNARDCGVLSSTVQQYYDNQWHLITFTYDSGNMKLYTDGILVSSATQGISTPATNLTIGYNGQGHYTGGLDDIRIYDRALSSAEIQSM